MISACVLAAGLSRRMGRDKLALPLDGVSVLQRTVALAEAVSFDEIVVVTRPDTDAGLSATGRRRLVVNPDPERGIASSIRVGVQNLGEDAVGVAILLGDQPFVRAVTIQLLLDGFLRSTERVLYPTFEGRRGHPVFWRRSLFEELAALRGDVGAKELIGRYGGVSSGIPVTDPGVCLDIDTPEDYARAKEWKRDPKD